MVGVGVGMGVADTVSGVGGTAVALKVTGRVTETGSMGGAQAARINKINKPIAILKKPQISQACGELLKVVEHSRTINADFFLKFLCASASLCWLFSANSQIVDQRFIVMGSRSNAVGETAVFPQILSFYCGK